MAKRDRAEYMRAYRAKRQLTAEGLQTAPGGMLRRISELEEEVRRLKRELASRPAPVQAHAFNSRPFRPVPKHSAK